MTSTMHLCATSPARMSAQVYLGTWHSVCKERMSPFAITFSGGSSSGTLARGFMKSKPSSTLLTAAWMGSLLKHKLLRKEIKSLADLMRIANSFAASDAAMRPIRLSPSGFIQGQQQQSAEAGANGPNRREMQRNTNFTTTTPNNNNNNINNGFNKRKDEQPDAQYNN